MLREIWRPPRLQSEVNDDFEHRATWLELFYDVVYVATINQLGTVFSEDISLNGFLRFVMIFIPLWWSWSGITFYMNRFIVDDLWHRLLIFVQIFAVSVVAISAADAFGTLATQFVLAYVLIRLVLILLYYRAGRHNPRVRPLTNNFIRGYGAGALIWVASLFAAQPLQLVLWIVGLAVELLVPFIPGIRRRQDDFPADPPHLTERYGLFTIIVLGEAFTKVITTASGVTLGVPQIVFSILVLTVLVSLWWMYFGDVAVSSIRPSVWAMYIWTYVHVLLAIGIALYSVAAEKLFPEALNAAPPADIRNLYGGALMIALAAHALINSMTKRNDNSLESRWRAGIRLTAALVIAAITLLGAGLSLLAFLLLLSLVFAVQVVIDILSARALLSQPDAASDDNTQTGARA